MKTFKKRYTSIALTLPKQKRYQNGQDLDFDIKAVEFKHYLTVLPFIFQFELGLIPMSESNAESILQVICTEVFLSLYISA